MKKNIHTLAELRVEIERLTIEKLEREHRLSGYIKDYANSLKPANLIKSAFGSITSDPSLKGMLKSKGVEAAMGFIVSQLIFKNSNPFVRTAATVLGTGFASNIFGQDGPNYLDKLKVLYKKFKNRKNAGPQNDFNERDIYRG